MYVIYCLIFPEQFFVVKRKYGFKPRLEGTECCWLIPGTYEED